MSKETKLEIKEEEILKVEETNDVPDGATVVDTIEIVEQPKELTIEECADLISKTKVLDIIQTSFSKYEGKVVLAMAEVRDLIKAITTAIEE